MLLPPPVRFYNLVWISRCREDLRHQRIRIQCDRRNQLLQLVMRQSRILNRWLGGGRARLGERCRRSGEYEAA